MADKIRFHSWERTPLGPIEFWPRELVASVNMMLTSKLISCLIWGPERILIYNDLYKPLLAHKSPTLGERFLEVWPEIREQAESLIAEPWKTGEANIFDRVSFLILMDGELVERICTLTNNPVYVQTEQGSQVAGLYQTVIDHTDGIRAERSLRASEARATRILQSIGDAVIVTDAESRILRMNPIAEQLTRWTLEEAEGVPLSQVFRIVNEETRETVESPVEKVKRLGSIVGLANHTVLIGKDNIETHIDDSGAPIRDEAGELAGIVLVFRNINERRAAERERAALTEQLRRVHDATTDSILSIDRDWRISYLNAPAQAAAGPLADAVGKNFWENFPDAVYEGSPFVTNYYRAMDEGIAAEFEAYYPGPLKIWVQVQVRPTTEGIILFFRNVTDQKHAKQELERTTEALRENQARIKAIYDSTDVYLALLTPDGSVLDCNQSSLSFAGNALKDVVGRKFWETPWFTGTPGAPESLQDFIRRAAHGEFIRAEFPLLRPDGKEIFFDFVLSPVRDEHGKVVLLVPEARDITDLKRAEAALLQSEKLAAVGRLASSIAHEINNPLESVTNLLYLARGYRDLPEEIRDYLDTAERELRRVAVITNQTLSFNKQATDPTPTICHELMDNVLSIYQGRLVNSKVKVEERKRATKPVLCSEGEIRQVISNLVGNAIDAMHPTGGRLLIRSREATHWPSERKGLILTVADTGSGISPSVIKKIFEPFFTTKGIGGTGLGLWVSCEIVNRHHGSLRVRSSRKKGSSGTVFTLFLPFDAVIPSK